MKHDGKLESMYVYDEERGDWERAATPVEASQAELQRMVDRMTKAFDSIDKVVLDSIKAKTPYSAWIYDTHRLVVGEKLAKDIYDVMNAATGNKHPPLEPQEPLVQKTTPNRKERRKQAALRRRK